MEKRIYVMWNRSSARTDLNYMTYIVYWCAVESNAAETYSHYWGWKPTTSRCSTLDCFNSARLTNIRLLIRAIWAVLLTVATPALRDACHPVLTHKLFWAAGLWGWKDTKKKRIIIFYNLEKNCFFCVSDIYSGGFISKWGLLCSESIVAFTCPN